MTSVQGRSLEAIETERRVIDLRTKGLSFYRIDRELGITNADRVFRRAMARDKASREEAYLLENERLDRLNEAVWDGAVDGSLPHVDRALKVSERRSKLIGLDHSDKMAEAAVTLEASRVQMVASALAAALDALGLTPDQRVQAETIVVEKLSVAEQLEELI